MTDENTDRIRVLQQQISEWHNEHEQIVRWQRDWTENLNSTLALSMRVALWGAIPSLVWILGWVAATGSDNQVVVVIGALILLGTVVAGAARAGGLLAHWWFRDSFINERFAAVIITLAADAIVLGWIMVYLQI